MRSLLTLSSLIAFLNAQNQLSTSVRSSDVAMSNIWSFTWTVNTDDNTFCRDCGLPNVCGLNTNYLNFVIVDRNPQPQYWSREYHKPDHGCDVINDNYTLVTTQMSHNDSQLYCHQPSCL